MVQRRSIVFAACLTITAVAGLSLGWLMPTGEPPAPEPISTQLPALSPRTFSTAPATEADQAPPVPSSTATHVPPSTPSSAELAEHSMSLLEDHLEASLEIVAALPLDPAERMQVERALEKEFDHLTLIAQDADLGGLGQSAATAEWERVRLRTDITLQNLNVSNELSDFRQELSPPWATQP